MIAYPLLTDIPAYITKGSILADWQSMRDKFNNKNEETQSSSTSGTSDTIQTSKSEQNNGPTTQSSKDEQQLQDKNSTTTSVTSINADKKDEQVKYLASDIFPARITIPRIEVEWIVNEGADVPTLKKGPGHIPETPLPGEEGRCTISGHRTTYGAPFNRIDELKKGDLIYIEAINGSHYIYKVTSFQVVKPTFVEILNGTNKKELLLTTCYPEYSAKERLVVIAELIAVFPFDLNLK
ncbi:MAG: class E sortase [Actinobacteria bacterium]|nr:class E sortase [Actinomycetota bacterium]